MKGLGDALKIIFEKIGAFFDLFDLSFFVSGAACIGAALFWLHLTGTYVVAKVPDTLVILALVLASYVVGLICFAAFRAVRVWALKLRSGSDHKQLLRQAMEAHGLGGEVPFTRFHDSDADLTHLYTRLWAEVRESKDVVESYGLLRRYWVLSATCDGLAAALCVWAYVLLASSLGLGMTASPVPVQMGLLAALALLMALVAGREAGRFTIYQVFELVSTVSYMRDKEQAATDDEEQRLQRLLKQEEALSTIPRRPSSSSSSSTSSQK